MLHILHAMKHADDGSLVYKLHYVFNSSPDGTSVYGSRCGEFEGSGYL